MATAPEVPNFAQFNFVEGDTIAMITKQNGQNAALVSYGQGLETFGEEIEQEQAEAIQTVENIRDNEVIPARDSAQAAATAASESEQQAEYWADQAAGSVADGYIDDSVTATNKTWSSSKIDARLNADRDPTISFDFVRDEYFIDNGERTFAPAEWAMTVERASPKSVEGPNGYLREVAPNTIARNWRNGVCLGALIEGSATNLLTYSSQFDNAAWKKADASIIANSTTAPDGTETADELVEGGGSFGKSVGMAAIPVISGASFNFSVFAKKAERSVVVLRASNAGIFASFDLAEGSVINSGWLDAQITEVEGGWFRVSATYTPSATGNEDFRIHVTANTDGNISYTGDGTSGVYVWGAQLEEGSQPSSYIKTEDTPVTRADDNVSRTLGAEFNADGFTIFSNSYLAYGAMLSLHNGTFDELIVFKISNSGSNLTIDFRSSGAPAGTYTRALEYFGGGISGSVALAISSSGSCVVAVNGVADTFSINAIPSVTTMQLSRSASRSVDQSTKAHYARIDAIPRALTEAELVELTS